MRATGRKSDFKLTTDTPYLALTGELWGAYYENFEEKLTVLYLAVDYLDQKYVTLIPQNKTWRCHVRISRGLQQSSWCGCKSWSSSLFFFFRKHIVTFYIIPLHWENTGTWNLFSQKSKTCLSYTVNIMAADGLVTCHQGISSHGIDPVLSEYPSFSTPRVNLKLALMSIFH